jgi:hypothetical protein
VLTCELSLGNVKVPDDVLDEVFSGKCLSALQVVIRLIMDQQHYLRGAYSQGIYWKEANSPKTIVLIT